MFSMMKITAAVALCLTIPATAAAAPSTDCTKLVSASLYLDCVQSQKVGDGLIQVAKTALLTHGEAVVEYAWYAKWFYNKWSDLKVAEDNLKVGLILSPGTVSGDDIVDDEATADSDAWEWLRVLIRLLLAAAANADDIVFNSVYDGTIYSPSNGTSTSAVLQLGRLGNNVTATLWTDIGLVVDTSWFITCPDVDVPASVFSFTATMVPSTLRAEGQTTRNITVAGFGVGSVNADYSIEVLSDYEHIVADVDINTPTGCSDTTLTGTFTRRIGSEFQ